MSAEDDEVGSLARSEHSEARLLEAREGHVAV
jgi:hypothetical protein